MKALSSPCLLIIACALVMLEFVLALGPEWSQNAQYGYGWFTPFLFVYLIYNRSAAATEALRGSKNSGTPWAMLLCLFVLLALLPVRIVLEGNPEWRLALWAQAVLCVTSLWLLWFAFGGFALWRLLFPASLLLFFAVPWPTGVESSLTLGLMSVVTSLVVEGMNFLGFYAERMGNLIRLRTGWVGVEEACSGVRSLQSTLMAGWFFGEVFRLKWAGRLALLALGVLTSFALNVIRTYLLTYFTLRGGEDLVGMTHDPMGHLIAGIAFVALLGWALLVRRFGWASRHREDEPPAPTPPPSPDAPPTPALRWQRWLPLGLGLWLCAIHLVAWAWYARVELGLERLDPVTVDWSAYPAEINFPEINPIIRNELRYTTGMEAEWREGEEGTRWNVFFFSWDAGSISPFVGVHNPESCLPASGFQRVGQRPPLVVEMNGREVSFEATGFRFIDTPVEVFYASWSNAEGGADLGRLDLRGRLRNAVRGLRMTDRQSLQIVMRGDISPEQAREEAIRFLEAALSN